HTRFSRDWSSDVCSSDLAPLHHRTPGLLGAALSEDRLVTSLIADLVHVHPAAIKTAFRAKGRRGIILVTDAVASQAARVGRVEIDRKSTRLNSSHVKISY